jgi:hypothetical protein
MEYKVTLGDNTIFVGAGVRDVCRVDGLGGVVLCGTIPPRWKVACICMQADRGVPLKCDCAIVGCCDHFADSKWPWVGEWDNE